MKKLLFTFFGLILLGTSSVWGALTPTTTTPTGYFEFSVTQSQLATEYGWTSGKTTTKSQSWKIGNVSFVTSNSQSSYQNGNWRGGVSWTLYFQHDFGPLDITADDGYIIKDLKFDYSVGGSGKLTDKTNDSGTAANPAYAKNTLIPVNAKTKHFNIGNTAGTGGFVNFTTFFVSYYKLPTKIDMDESMTVEPNSTFKIGQVLPYDAYQVWSTTDEGKVSVDQNGVVTAKEEGSATIKVTFGDGTSKSCVVTVETSSDESMVETFKNAIFSVATTSSTVDGVLATWEYVNIRRANSDVLRNGEKGSRFQAANTAHYTTTTALEGGIKRVSFYWNSASPFNENNHNFTVSAGTVPDNVVKMVVSESTTEKLAKADLFYTHDFNVKQNATLSITNNQTARYLLIGNIKVTPYLLYKTKSADAYEVGYKNDDLINNLPSGETVAYTLENNDGVAEIDPSTGEITKLLKDGTVTVKASWNEGKVYTTYQLTVHVAPKPEVSFADGKAVTKSMNVVTYTNTLNFISPQAECGAVTYSSDNKAVATVDNNGLVNIMGEGTANILVHIAQGTTYAEKDTSYALTVTDPMEKAIIENFRDTTLKAQEFKDSTIGKLAKWEYQYARRSASDILQNGALATWLNYYNTAHITTTDVLEGGIKRVSFLWNRANKDERIVEFVVSTGAELQNKDTVTKTTSGSIERLVPDVVYNHNFFVKGNSKLSINHTGAQDGNKQSRIWIGDIKITPYIYYTRKDTTVLAKDYASITFTNDKFINNIGTEGSITYAIKDATSKTAIAEILDENSGAVTIHGAGVVEVIATWSEGATTTYKLTILKEKPIVTLEGATIDAFGSYTAAPTATVGGEPIASPAFSYKSSNELVATVDNSGVVTIHGTGTTNIRAILAEGDNYRSDSVEAELKVNEPVGANYWKETFDSVPDISDYITSTKTYYGNKAVYWWQMRSFQHNTSGNKDKVGSEQGIRIKFDSKNNNYIASNRVEEGGIQAVFFNWCLAGDGTATARFSRIAPKNDTKHSKNDTLNIVRDNVTKGYNNVNSYVEVLNIDKNARFQVRIPSGDEAVVFGPITIKPYLLYTTKDTTINVLEYNGIKTFTNGKVIDNTGAESDGITYSIKSVTPAGAAEILEANKHNGQVTIHGAGTAVVQAKWGDVTTTYTLRINGGELNLAFARNHIDTTMNAETFTNTLSGVKTGAGTLTYTSDNVRVAKVDKTTGVVSAMGLGDATITANVAAGTIYKAASASFTIHVDEVSDPEEELIEEKFPDYAGSPWTTIAQVGPDTVKGDLGDWELSYARHAEKDSISINERAVWFNTNGYIRTLSIEGGIKRVKFNYNKVKTNKTFSVIAGSIKDTITAESFNHTYTYNHNFFLKHNDTLKIHNITGVDFLVGTIIVTPYLYYSVKADTIKVADYKKSNYDPTFLINNTNGGTITYSSSNPEVATVTASGSVKPLKASAEPVIITAKWKSSDTDSVTTSFSLKINDKDARSAWFSKSKVNVERGATPENTLNIPPVQDDTVPAVVYVSSDTAVAKIAADKKTVLTVGPGTTIITAQMSETGKCLAGQASYELTVTYTPTAGSYWTETFSKAGDVTSSTTSKTINGDDNMPNKWILSNFMRHPGDTVGPERGIRVQYSGSIASNVALEGGVKEVVFNWHPLNTGFDTYFYVQVGDSTHNISLPQVLDATKVIPYAHSFGDYGKSNTSLKIGNYASGVPVAHGHPVIGEVNVIPYLLYTRKDTTLVASEMGGVYTFTNDKLINNTGDEVADHFTYTVRAKDNAVSIANEHSGQLTIIGAGIDTIQAAWEGVTTTYVVHVVLEDANLAFAKQDSTVMINAGSCTQVATTSSSATIKYEFEGEHDGAEITQDGTVTFSKTGEFHILATVPVALPYNLDSARYTLTVNNKPTPEVEFKDTTVDMNSVPFVRPAQSIPASGMGQAHYSSDDVKIATVEELTGIITVIGEGTATISVHYDAGEAWEKADASFKVIVTDPMDDAIVENFNNETYKASASLQTKEWKLATWEYQNTRRALTDTLKNGTRATWMNYNVEAHLKTTAVLEGGIKRVSFPWNFASNGEHIAEFVVMAGNELQVKDTVSKHLTAENYRVTPDLSYNHNFSIKENAKLAIYRTGEIPVQMHSFIVVGDIKITPYLYYTMKDTTIKVGESYNNKHLIDNRDDEQTISYSIIAGNDKKVATIDAEGNVSATRACELTIQAKWGDVTTTYHLSIVAEKTTITLYRNDGTSDADTIVNNYGEAMPQFTLPTLTGYRFNAYWTRQDTAKGSYRFTVTTADSATVWVKSRYIKPDTIVDYKRNWVYEGTTYTFYADWRPERKIALDNQGATTPGTDTVVTAYCPNNNLLRLTEKITKPVKTNYTFQGYYTEANGAGAQLIDANGAFKASVAGYTDKDKWFIKDADITLYAHWKVNTDKITLDEGEDNHAILDSVDGKTLDVTLKRSLVAGMYNTICLPFGIKKTDLETVFGTITSLATLAKDEKADVDDAKKNVSIYIEEADSIEPGKPYLINPVNAVPSPMVFKNVTIQQPKEEEDSVIIGDGVKFYGILSPYVIPGNKPSILFVVTNNRMAWNSTGKNSTMKGFRSYFEIPGMNSGSGVAPRLVMRQPTTPTDLMQNAECKMQNVQKVVINNQIYIIRNGVYYNVSGQIVR